MKNKIHFFAGRNKLIIAFIAVIAILATAFTWKGMALYVNASSEFSEEKSFCTATVDDDFKDDTVVLVLNKQSSLKFSNYTAEDFPELRLKSVENINENATRIVQNQIKKGR